MEQLVLTGLIVLFASFTFGFAGFGFSLIAVPLLAIYMETRGAVVFQFPYSLIMTAYLCFRAKDVLIWRQTLQFFLWATLGLPVGFYFVDILPETISKKILGAFVLAFVIVSFLPFKNVFAKTIRQGRAWEIVFGFLCGTFQGGYNTGGPPLVVYAITVYEDKEKAKGLMLSIFLYLQLILLAAFIFGKYFTVHGLLVNLYYLPAMVLGSWLGIILFNRADNTLYRKVVLLLLFTTSLFLLLKS
jgi:uncharacterized membrane protein YfcA